MKPQCSYSILHRTYSVSFHNIDIIRILLLVVHSHCFLLLFYFCDNSLAIGNKILLNKIMSWPIVDLDQIVQCGQALHTHRACIIHKNY